MFSPFGCDHRTLASHLSERLGMNAQLVKMIAKDSTAADILTHFFHTEVPKKSLEKLFGYGMSSTLSLSIVVLINVRRSRLLHRWTDLLGNGGTCFIMIR